MRRKRVVRLVAAGGILSSAFIVRTNQGGAHPIPIAQPIVVSHAYRFESDRVRSNETLTHLFGRHQVYGAELHQLIEAGREHGLNPRRVMPGTEFAFRKLVGSDKPDLVRFRVRDDGFLTFTRDTAGVWESSLETIAWRRVVERLYGTITSSLYDAVQASVTDSQLPRPERDELVWGTAEAVFGWVIDFTKDPRSGDRFEILFERLVSDAGDVRYGRILAARFEVQGRAYNAYLLPNDRGDNQYFDEAGRSLHRAFLKYPVQFRRMSSGFSRRRFHPILGVYRAHLGTDYSADIGTPIRATGDGVVEFAGRNGGFGLMVEIRHPKGIQTRYAHMSRIERGIQRGTRVSQGQTIGRVGMTGLANGPHVHYEFLKNGRQVNHRSVDLGDGAPLAESVRPRFEATRTEYDRVLSR